MGELNKVACSIWRVGGHAAKKCMQARELGVLSRENTFADVHRSHHHPQKIGTQTHLSTYIHTLHIRTIGMYREGVQSSHPM